MKKVALSVFEDRISSRLDSSDKILLLTLENDKIDRSEWMKIIPNGPLAIIDQIIELDPDVLICGGLTQLCDTKLKTSRITVIPWIKGDIEKVLEEFIEGKLSKSVLINN